MYRILGNLILACALLVMAGPSPLEAADCKTMYRIYQDGENTYFKYGEDIVLTVGDRVDLFIHAYPSRSKTPYSAMADIGAPNAFGGNHRPQDVSRVLKLGKHDDRKGSISLVAIATGRTGLGYRMRRVVRPGRIDDVPVDCRTGEVKITVRDAAARTKPPTKPAPSASSANDAAHVLIKQLYTGILRRSESEANDYPDSFFDQVQDSGLQGLIAIAETMVSSSEFRQAALNRTREGLAKTGVSADNLGQGVLENQLLTDIFTSLYGSGAKPYADAQRRMASLLSTCLSGRGGDGCNRLGRDLLSQPQYQNRNRELLQILR